MKKIDVSKAPERVGSRYPLPFRTSGMNKSRRKLGEAARLTQFGVNLITLQPGAVSSQRHWHSHEDEMIFVVEGEVVLITDTGEETLRPGDCAGFKAGDPDGHHVVNRSDRPAVMLEIGTRDEAHDATVYPDIDLWMPAGATWYHHKDGAPYPND